MTRNLRWPGGDHQADATPGHIDARPEAARQRPGLGRPPLAGNLTQEQAAEMLDHHRTLAGHMGDVLKALDALTPRVIGVQTIALDANGNGSAQYRVPFGCITVDSQSTKVLTVANMPPQGNAPGPGPGVAVVKVGGFVVANFRSYQWSIYGGVAGELVTVTAYAHPQSPATR